MEKAAPVYPPQPESIDVDMTTVYTVMSLLTVSTVGLGISTTLLWRKARKNEEYITALGDYVSRLVKDTECGKVAYQTFLDDEEEDEVVVWDDESGSPFPTESQEVE